MPTRRAAVAAHRSFTIHLRFEKFPGPTTDVALSLGGLQTMLQLDERDDTRGDSLMPNQHQSIAPQTENNLMKDSVYFKRRKGMERHAKSQTKSIADAGNFPLAFAYQIQDIDTQGGT